VDLNFKTIRWENGTIVLLDQTRLPEERVERVCHTVEDVHEAISVLATRGAPLLGITAAYGLCLGLQDFHGDDTATFFAEVKRVSDFINSSRPTAVNLFWALERMRLSAERSATQSVSRLQQILFEEARTIHQEDERLCRGIGESGAGLIEDGDVILTHCNAGALATGGIGTALAPLYVAREQGKQFRVYADETRPLLQGARLTAWELHEAGIDVTLNCDNMAGVLMQKKVIKKVITGADRIAKNGDTANKIGTYSLAVLARYHGIPFYIAAPYSTFDLACNDGPGIPIEERSAEELKKIGPQQTAPRAVKAYNPAFDVTPHALITAFITERGLMYPPFDQTLATLQGL
jgi:methylthioribose-1-phosphate isomerase